MYNIPFAESVRHPNVVKIHACSLSSDFYRNIQEGASSFLHLLVIALGDARVEAYIAPKV